jgi:hypothetical protein
LTIIRVPVQHRRYDKLSPRRFQELAPAAQEAMGFRVAAQATKESGCAVLVRVPVSSVVDVFGAEVRPGSQREHDEIAELNDESAGHVSPEDGVAEKVDKGQPMSSR